VFRLGLGYFLDGISVAWEKLNLCSVLCSFLSFCNHHLRVYVTEIHTLVSVGLRKDRNGAVS